MRTSRPGGQLDRSSSSAAQKRTARDITGGVRDGYVSFHLVALLNGHLTYTLDLSAPSESAIQTDIYREWFHHLEADKGYYPDALIPVQLPYRSRLPEPDNRISGQTAQAFWVDM
jgi:hypothetical protein